MGTQEFMLIRALVPPSSNDLFIVGDGHQRIFNVFSQGLTRSKSHFQIIVLEHAGKEIWKDIPLTHSVENWSVEGDGLILASWT